MAKYVGYKRPKDTKKTIRHLLVYLGMHKWSFLLVALLVLISAGANITGTYLLKPVINRFIVPGDLNGLVRAVAAMGVMYLCGALATLGYNRLMVKTSQKVIREIRSDLFAHVQKLPLRYFDAHTHGELMSRFTNDVDAVQEAMNNSFAMIIQSFMMLFGTVIMMMVLSIRLSLIVVVFFNCYVCGYPLKWKAQQKNILTGSRRNSAKLTDLYRKWQRDRRSKRYFGSRLVEYKSARISSTGFPDKSVLIRRIFFWAARSWFSFPE